MNEFRLCERRYFLDKMSVGLNETNIDFAFGHAVGAGVQTLFRTGGRLDYAILATFAAFNTDFFDENPRTKKNIAFAIHAVQNFLPFYQILSTEWELAEIAGIPAVEYSMVIEFPDDFRYRSYVDFVLRHKETGKLAVHEIKTNGSNFQHEALYANSDQGLSYNLVIDQLAPDQESFDVSYWVYHSGQREWVPYSFTKTLLDKAKWLRTTLLDLESIRKAEETDFWPTRGAACMSFGRVCPWFGICKMRDESLSASPERLMEKMQVEQAREYSFVVPLEQIVENYLAS